MITFATQEEFDAAVMRVIETRVKVGVTVRKEREYWPDDREYTKVEVSLFDAHLGIDIDRGSDLA